MLIYICIYYCIVLYYIYYNIYMYMLLYIQKISGKSHISNPCFYGKEIDNEKAGDKRSQ